jgi:hypothetical protein
MKMGEREGGAVESEDQFREVNVVSRKRSFISFCFFVPFCLLSMVFICLFFSNFGYIIYVYICLFTHINLIIFYFYFFLVGYLHG